MFSSSIKRGEKKEILGLQGGLHRRCVAERGGGEGEASFSLCAMGLLDGGRRGFLHSSSVYERIALLSESRRMEQDVTHSLAV